MRTASTRFAPRAGRLFLAAVLAALAGLLAAPVRAQIADAVLETVVSDQSRAALPGVTVTVIRPDTGYQQTAVTDELGVARFVALPPGAYTAKLELSGFTTVEQGGLTLRVGQTLRIEVQMGIAQLAETVNVVGEAPLVDVFKTDSSTNVVPEQIEMLPVQDRDVQRLAFLAPGVQRERGAFRFVTGGPVLGAGGNASQSTIMVDGVDFTDPTLGLARARFSQDAVSEFRVITNRFDTEIGGSAGGALSIVTKSGTNTLGGSAFAFFRDDALRAKGEFEQDKVDYSRQQWGGSIGGPLVRDRTHFFASFEQINEDNLTLFRPGGAFTSLADDLPLPVDQTLLFAGVDHRFSDTQLLRTKFVYERYRQENFRVGGVAAESYGIALGRDNYNFTATHNWTVSNVSVNQFSFSFGQRKFDEANNSPAVAEWFSQGNTLQTGGNITGVQDDTGHILEFRDTFYTRVGAGRWAADLKFGGGWQAVTDEWDFPVYPTGLLLYATDTRAVPIAYAGATGSGLSKIDTNLISGFAQADLRPSARVTINLGLRYDIDTDGNNPDFTSPLQPEARGQDTNNLQPRAGFSWDVAGDGRHVVRGGVGMFTGRFLLVPGHVELQQNGYTGRIIQQRVNGLLFGLPPAFWLDPANPTTTGIPLARDANRIDDTLVSPWATQATVGYTVKLGDTGLFADFEGIYVKGDEEIVIRDLNWSGNGAPGCNVAAANCRPNKTFNQINAYTNNGRSEYKAFVASVNGTIAGGHLITSSFTVADKKNIADDFSPEFPFGYPNDPADMEAEWGRSRSDERYRFVASGVFRLPWRFTVAPIFEYGSGQPWNERLGYDYNGDGKNSDRPAGVPKYDSDGPDFISMNLRVTYGLPLGARARADLVAEAFNLFNRVNYDVTSVQGGQYLSGPTLQNPALAPVANPRFGQYTATLPPFEAQLGVRFVF
jgi:hypothetical protein